LNAAGSQSIKFHADCGGPEAASMRILVSGSTGLVGSALMERLPREGHEVVRLVRPETRRSGGNAGSVSSAAEVVWSPVDGNLGAGADGADAVVHLAGVSIADGRWNDARKRALRDSRVAGTHNLIDALKRLKRAPQIFIAASAIGFYGSRGDEELTESSSTGSDFLAQTCQDWELESARAADLGARVVILRSGVILAKNGGALPRIALPFRLGVGGPIGSGRQWMSWIALEDVVGIVAYALTNAKMTGAFNVVAPQPVHNAEFAKVLGRVLHRPAIFPTPGFMLRLALGEMADALLLSSQRVLPRRIEEASYRFARPELEGALRSVLTK
jgi:uncharacterized protein (TIGR01777 family)